MAVTKEASLLEKQQDRESRAFETKRDKYYKALEKRGAQDSAPVTSAIRRLIQGVASLRQSRSVSLGHPWRVSWGTTRRQSVRLHPE